jgi:hypothetical protein
MEISICYVISAIVDLLNDRLHLMREREGGGGSGGARGGTHGAQMVADGNEIANQFDSFSF